MEPGGPQTPPGSSEKALQVGAELPAHRTGRMLRVMHVHVEGAGPGRDRSDLRLGGTRATLALECGAERDDDRPADARCALVNVGRGGPAVDPCDRELPANLARRGVQADLSAAAVRGRSRWPLVRAPELSGQVVAALRDG